jgi:hypothetical protein
MNTNENHGHGKSADDALAIGRAISAAMQGGVASKPMSDNDIVVVVVPRNVTERIVERERKESNHIPETVETAYESGCCDDGGEGQYPW